MKHLNAILIFSLVAISCMQDPESPKNLPDAPVLSVDETSVTRVSMVANGTFGKDMSDITQYGVEISETLFEAGGTYKTLVPQEMGADGYSLGVTGLTLNQTYFLRAYISNGHSKLYSPTITQKTPESSVASLSDVTILDDYYLVATIEDDGGRNLEDVGFVWGEVNDRKAIRREKRYPGTLGADGKTLTLPLSDIGKGTYYVLAYAEDDKDGTGFSRIPFELVLKDDVPVRPDEPGSIKDGRWEAPRYNDDPTSIAFVAFFDGNNLDLYIIAWGQHYVGTYQFADGIITYNISEAFQAYTDVTYDNEGQMVTWSWEAGNLDASTLTLSEGYDWYEMDAESLAAYQEDLKEFSFLLQDGNTSATSSLFGIEDLVFKKVD